MAPRLRRRRAVGVIARRKRFANIWSGRDDGERRWAIPGTRRAARKPSKPKYAHDASNKSGSRVRWKNCRRGRGDRDEEKTRRLRARAHAHSMPEERIS